ncbi:hypothetical protein BDU57DRAFT_154665 [Ampelomyces quisqualis]|uniref:Uncharacterized protein n=1 Tax=Ampelomyces quisqualis TaxID=50730 RepID=A0A6A5QYB5_AMPQU|nr:hypothetical protein BDU57DRAFT_154665 [Ampelomyces quisqualis]
MPSLLTILTTLTTRTSPNRNPNNPNNPTQFKNPYLNPHHPTHTPIPIPHPPSSSSSPPSPPNTVPVTNLLAQARLSANRDPITGKILPGQKAAAGTHVHATARLDSSSGAREEYSARAFRAGAQSARMMGAQRDLVVGRESVRGEEGEGSRVAGGGREFYAPERRVEEFYAGGVRDW